MNVVKKLVKNSLVGAAALVAVCWAQTSLAGYKSTLSANGVGQVGASLGYTFVNTNSALTGNNLNQPSAGVSQSRSYTAFTTQPSGTSLISTSTVTTVFITGGYKAVAKSWVSTSGDNGIGSADPSPEFLQKLLDDGYILVPAACASSYGIASGDETIAGQRYLIVLGTATVGTATWFRGYFFDTTANGGPPTDRDDIVTKGVKLYDVVVKGPFDFGDINSPDRCKALKIPIDYTGPDLYLLSDGTAASTTDLQISCPNGTIALAACSPSYPSSSVTTSGGCPPVNISFSPDVSTISPGTTAATITATATDFAGNTATCTFTVSRPGLHITGCPTTTATSPYALAACNPSYPSLGSSGGCAPVNIGFSPAISTIAPGTTSTLVTATARDGNGSVDTCQFYVSRPGLQITGCGPINAPCGTTVSYAGIGTSGGCAPVSLTFDKAANTLGPGNTLVTATARDASGQVTTCQFTVTRPYLDLGTSGFGSPVNGPGGTCNPPAPTAVVKGAGNNVPIKFTTYLCGTAYSTGRTATITIKKFNSDCQPIIELTGIQLTPTSATYHWQWKTLVTDVGFFQISVNLNDGNPNPSDPKLSAVVQLTP